MQKKSKPARTKKQDPLAPYRKQAAPIIRILFDEDDDTPDFVVNELQEILTDLESATQVFWNTKEIAVVAIPLMLQAADRRGIDIFNSHSSFVSQSLGGMYRRDCADDVPELSDFRRLQSDLEADAEAMSRVIRSPHTPTHIVELLTDAVNDVVYNADAESSRAQIHYAPDVLRASYSNTIRTQMREAELQEVEGRAGDKAE
jgi:hypothetical protein